MSRFRIYYGDGSTVDGATPQDWLTVPGEDVQVVAVFEPRPVPARPLQTGIVGCPRFDRTFYCGLDSYDPLNTGRQILGRLIDDDEFRSIWNRAYGDD